MKQKLFLVIAGLMAFMASGQTSLITTQGSPNRTFEFLGGVWVDGIFRIPVLDQTVQYTNVPMQGRFQLNSTTLAPEWHDGTSWKSMLTSGSFKTVGGQSIIGTGNVTEVQNSMAASAILSPSVTAVNTALSAKQDALVSGTNIKTIETQSIVGSGNLDLNKADVGLSLVDNTADNSKPVSTAQAAAINAKVEDNLTASTTVAPSKTAVNTALAGKQNTLVSGTNIKTVGGQSLVGSGNITEVQDAMTASTVLSPSVTAVNTALALKASLAGPQTYTGVHSYPTATAGTNTTQAATTAFVTGAVATASTGNIKQNGNDFGGLTAKIGTSVNSDVEFIRNGSTYFQLSSSTVGLTSGSVQFVADEFKNVGSGSVTNLKLGYGTPGFRPTTLTRTTTGADTTPSLVINYDNTSATGDIIQFSSTAGGSGVKAGVRIDGKNYGADGVAANDYFTVGQQATANALNMQLAGTQTVTGDKTFTGLLKYSSVNFESTVSEYFTIKNKVLSGAWSRGFLITDNTNADYTSLGAFGIAQALTYGYIGLGSKHTDAPIKWNSNGVGINMSGTTAPTTGAALTVSGNSILSGFTRVSSTASASRFSVYNDFATTGALYGGQVGSTRNGFAVSVGDATVQPTDIAFNISRMANPDVGSGLVTPYFFVYGNGNAVVNGNVDSGFKFDVNGTTRIQGELTTKSASASLDFPSVAGTSSADLTITYSGAAVGDVVLVGIPASAIIAGTVYSYWVSAANTVTIRCNNYTATALNPAAGTFTAKIIK